VVNVLEGQRVLNYSDFFSVTASYVGIAYVGSLYYAIKKVWK